MAAKQDRDDKKEILVDRAHADLQRIRKMQIEVKESLPNLLEQTSKAEEELGRVTSGTVESTATPKTSESRCFERDTDQSGAVSANASRLTQIYFGERPEEDKTQPRIRIMRKKKWMRWIALAR